MTKHSILFVCASVKVGGAEKSLVNLLNMIDYDKYNVSLLLLQKQGALMEQIPANVTMVDLPDRAKALYDDVNFSLSNLSMKAIKYISTGLEHIKYKEYDVLRAHRWKDYYQKKCESLRTKYDTVVAFQSGESTYYAFDKIKADRYVTFFHTDIKNIKIAKEIEKEYLKKADLIATISPKCVESICNVFPEFSKKTVCLENPSSAALIKKMAGDVAPEEYRKKEAFIIVSVGRLIDIKGYDMVVDACSILKNGGLSFHWYIVGEGNERKKLEKQIKEKDIADCVHLIGLRMNPYPYMKFANLLVQSSRYEGKSMVLDEAKILGKQILVTNYNSAKDQITDGVDGHICEMSAYGIAEGVKKAIQQPIAYALNCTDKNVDHYMQVLTGECV